VNVAAPGAARSITDVGDAWPTLEQVWNTLTLRAGFNTTSVVLGTSLLGVAAGVVGVFALLRKRSLTADALSHATLPGIALAFILVALAGGAGRSVPVLLLGGAASGILGVLVIQGLIRHTRLTEDAAIGVVLSVFFGAGVVLLSIIQSMRTGGQGGLRTFIYGQTAAITRQDAVLMGALALVAIVLAALLFKELTAVCFDDAFAQVSGFSVGLIDLLMMGLIVMVTIGGMQAVGLILVVAMLIIPPAAARFWSERLSVVIVVSALIGGASGYLGSAVSALLPRKPAGAVIVLTAGMIFLLSLLAAPSRGVIAWAARRARLRLRISSEHVLEALFDAEHTREQLPAARRALGLGTSLIVPILLRARGLAQREAGRLVLTEAGRREGARISRNHRLWEQYLVSYAHVAPSHVDWSVDQVEHVLGADQVRELESALRARGVPVPAGATS